MGIGCAITCNLELPVAVAHVGCVTVPAVGAAGVAGCALTTILDDAGEVQPAALVCVKVYVPELALLNLYRNTTTW
jgi:hypothetical protein